MSKPETTSLPKSQNNSHDNLLLTTENALKTQLELNEKLKSKIISLKSSISYYKNQSFEFTENMTRQNELFLGWQEQVKEELKFLVSILSGRQKNKYEAWKREVREREAICKKVQKVSINSSASCSNLLTSDGTADGQNSPSLNLVPNSFAMCFSNGGVYPRQSGVAPSPPQVQLQRKTSIFQMQTIHLQSGLYCQGTTTSPQRLPRQDRQAVQVQPAQSH